jgi:DnaK suppressor protein
LNAREKERFKKMLLKKKEEIIDILSEVYSEGKEIEVGISQDVVDKAESSYTKEFLFSLSDVERKRLFMIDEAIKRIEDSSYGICQMCQNNIDNKRLAVVPWAPNCIECQEKEEKGSP